MENLVESSVFTANVSVPQDSIDLRNAASVNTAFQALANRTKYLNDANATQDGVISTITGDISDLTDNLDDLEARVVGDVKRFTLCHNHALTTWELSSPIQATPYGLAKQIDNAADILAVQCITPIIFIPDLEITNFGFTWAPATGHGALPANFPEMKLYSRSSSGAPTEIGSVAITAGSVGAYEVAYKSASSSVNIELTEGYGDYIELWAGITGEWGANSVANGHFVSAFVTVGVP